MRIRNQQQERFPIFCLSLDLELLWGYHDLSGGAYGDKIRQMKDVRERIYDLIGLLEECDFRCTWAVITHLFLDSCQGHPDYPDESWLERDPKSDIDRDPLWYGRDIVKRLLRNPDFEVACHSFSHTLFNEIDEEQARYELNMSEQIAKELDPKLKFKSFVFPRDEVGHRKLLSEFGYKAYRSPISRSKSLTRFFDYAFPTEKRAEHYSPKPLKPRIDEYGLVDIPCSMFLSNSRLIKLVSALPPRNYIKWKIEKGIEKLVNEGGVIHFSMHPHNYGRSLPKEDFLYVLKLVEKHKIRGELQVLTMSEVADFLL